MESLQILQMESLQIPHLLRVGGVDPLKFEGIPSTTRKEGLHHTNKIKAKALKPF